MLYAHLDELRERTSGRLAQTLRQTGGTPQARTERDVMVGMYTQRLEPTIMQIPASGYRGVTAYARAKRAQVALSREWARRLAGTGIAFHAMHPGWVNTPGIAAALPRFHAVMRPLL